MNAYELADIIEKCVLDGSTDLVCVYESVIMLRQQAQEIETLNAKIDKLLDHCQDPECWTCGAIICPHGGEMHFHHDGCPTCAEMESQND